MKTDAELLAEANALDALYASAAEHDAAQLDKWVREKFTQFTKRTNFPKLGYLIHLLNEAGIASIQHGHSFHAPILMVERGREDEAWSLLDSNYFGRPLDEVSDDAPSFQKYADTRPDTDLY